MKYLFTFLIVLLFAFTFIGCKTSDSEVKDDRNKIEEQEEVLPTREEEVSVTKETSQDQPGEEKTESDMQDKEEDIDISEKEEAPEQGAEETYSQEDMQDKIDELIEDIKEGNVIPDDHE